MKRKITYCLVTLFLVNIIFAQTCPECYNNRPHIPGHGTTTDGRTIVKIWIQQQQGTPEYSILNGAVGGASSSWNNATDSSGNRIHYHFDQTTNQNEADFVVRVGTPAGGCATIDTSVYPHVITVSANAMQQTTGAFEGVLKHEFGHRLGLAEAANTATCGSSTTIMRGHTNCVPLVQQIQQSDVAKARAQYVNQSSCTRVAPTTANAMQEGGCNPVAEEECF